MVEIWKDVVGYEGLYKVSNTGKVYSYKTNRILASGKEGANGIYRSVALIKAGAYKRKTVHRLVAEAFIPNPENKPNVNHIDHNTQNNNVNNLEWVTQSENMNKWREHYKKTHK